MLFFDRVTKPQYTVRRFADHPYLLLYKINVGLFQISS